MSSCIANSISSLEGKDAELYSQLLYDSSIGVKTLSRVISMSSYNYESWKFEFQSEKSTKFESSESPSLSYVKISESDWYETYIFEKGLIEVNSLIFRVILWFISSSSRFMIPFEIYDGNAHRNKWSFFVGKTEM